MPEFRKSLYDTSSKVDNLSAVKDTKLQNLGTARDELVWETKRLTSLPDVDSPRFEGVTGGLGGTDKDGTVYDKSEELSGDRIDGIDSYEVFPDSDFDRNYHYNDQRGIDKLTDQRTRLAAERGVDYSTITNEDVYEQGAIGAVKELALLQAYSMGDADYIEQVKTWTPDPEMSKKWRTEPVGIDVAALNIDVERAFSGGYGWYGRPKSQVRGIGSEQLIGEHSGYVYGDPATYTKAPVNAKDAWQAHLKSEAEDMGFWGRVSNGVDAFQRTFAKEVGLDFSDLVGEGVSYLTDGKYGWDHGNEEQKTKMVNDRFGFNPYAAEGAYKQAKIHADNITTAIYDDKKEVDFEDVYELVKIGITTPEMFFDSAAFIGSFFVPILGWGGKAAKATKVIKTIEAAKKAGTITEDAAKALILTEKANIHVLGKLRTFTQSNAGLMQVSANNVNDQIDKYKKVHGEAPSVYKVGQMFATESLLLGLDRWSDLSILKSPAALKGVREAFSVLPQAGVVKVLSKTVAVAANLTVNMGREAGQEYLQEIGQEFNVQFNFDDNGGFFSATAMDEAKTILLSKEMQTVGVMGAGLGAGGAVQFSGVGAVSSAIGLTSRLAGEKIKEQKKPSTTTPFKTNVTEETLEAKDFSDKDTYYRVVVGDAAFQDIVDSGVVRTDASSKKTTKEDGTIDLSARPTRWPSFSKNSASMDYAGKNEDHYIVVTNDPSIQPSKQGRHGTGTTQFPTDVNGVPMESLSGDAVSVYKHIGDGKYQLVYDKGVEVTGKTTAADLVKVTAAAISEADATVRKYSMMIGDDEFAKIYAANSLEDEEHTQTPNLKAKLAENPAEYRSAIEEIEKAEAVLQSRQDVGSAKDTDAVAFKLLRKAKREVYKNLIEDEGHPTLGSGYSEEDVIEGYLESVDVVDGKIQLSTTEEEALAAYAKLHDIPPLRFANLRKFRTEAIDAAAVHEEAVGTGSRSASSYKIALRNLVNTPNPSRKAVAGVIDKIDNFLNSQEDKKSTYEAAVAPLASDIATFNKSVEHGGKLNAAQVATKRRLKKGYNFPESKNFIAVTEDTSTGKLSIHPESLAIIESAKDTIGYLTRVKNRYSPQTKAILGDDFAGNTDGIIVRPNSAKQESRDKDTARYSKYGVTKAIVDTKKKSQAAQWGEKGDYTIDNASRINTGEYTADDVVVVHSTAKGFAKDSNVRKELKAAYKAGATVIIDNATLNVGSMIKLLGDKSHKFLKVKDDNGTRYMVKAKAEPIRAQQSEKLQKKRVNETVLRKLAKAFTLKESLDGQSIDAAVKKGTITQKQADVYHKSIEEAAPLFAGGLPKMEEYYQNLVAKKTKEVTKRLIDIALTKGFQSAELNEAMAEATAASAKGTIPSTVATDAIAAVNSRVEELSEGELLLAAWNEAEKAAKKGDLDINQWVTENVVNAKKQAVALLANAIGKGRGKVYAYFSNDEWQVRSNKNKVPKDSTYQVIEQDPSTYVVVSKATPLNSYDAKELRIAGQDNIAFNQLVATAVGLLNKVIRAPNVVLGTTTNGIIETANSPAGTLIFDKDGNANENVAITASIALHNFIRHSAYLLKKGKKSKKDISEILGIDESQLSKAAIEMMSDKGLLYKTAADSIGKDIVAMLGLSRKSDNDIDAQNYDALVADLGQTALLMGIEQGLLEKDSTLSAAKFAAVVLRKKSQNIDKSGSAKVTFIQAVAGQEENLEHIATEAKDISEAIPNVDVSRKEPAFKPINSKTKAKRSKNLHKERLGITVPKASQDTMNEMMDTEWVASISAMSELVAYQEEIKLRLGYVAIDSEQYSNLSFNEKEIQESVNRSIEKPLEELEQLVNAYEDEDEISLWFERFFSKNGRFFIDSNTINPHTDKHLSRFTVQPKTHTQTYVRKGDKFTVGGKDVTFNVHYALAQAFGLAVDKKDTAKITKYGETVLKALNNKKKGIYVIDAQDALLSKGEFRFGDDKDHVIEVEHLGHAMQAFTFLNDSIENKGKPFTSALTAEFDAVTSGFGIKLLQMPIIGNVYNWLKKVGVVQNDDETLAGNTPISMNDLLDSGGVKDSYQELAAGIEVLSFEDMSDGLVKDTIVSSDSQYSKALWKALSEVLPSADGGEVSKELRDLFKYPFLTFNYAASIKTIRENLLTGELLDSIAKDMAAADLSDPESPIVKLMEAFVGPKGDIAALQLAVRTKPLYNVKASKGSKANMEQYLGQMIEASYGVQVEQVLTEQFGPFIEAQKKVNNAFKAMFEVFSVSFDIKLGEARKSGAVSVEKERSIYEELKAQWPMIKGPLSSMELELDIGDGIGIYDTQTASPTGIHSGRKPARANLSKGMEKSQGQKTIRVSHMIKQLSAAIASGSVVPIHFIDGAMMGQTINSLADAGVKGITDVFDAQMPPLPLMNEGQQEYNKQFIEVNTGYSFINEIMISLDKFLDETPLNSKKYKDRKVIVGKKEVSVKDFILTTRNEFATLANLVNKGREDLFATLNKGAKVMHMAGTPDGVYDVLPGSIDYKPVAVYKRRTYNKIIKVEGKTFEELQTDAKNLKC